MHIVPAGDVDAGDRESGESGGQLGAGVRAFGRPRDWELWARRGPLSLRESYMAAALAMVLWRRDRRESCAGWCLKIGVPTSAESANCFASGLPAAGQMAVEIGVFAVVTVLMGG